MFKKVNTALLGLALAMGMTSANADEAKKVDVLLIGGGIMGRKTLKNTALTGS